MLSKEKLTIESKKRGLDNSTGPDKNLHAKGVRYICSFLERVGVDILEINNDPNHHFQLLAKINDKSLLIAVRSAFAPEVGTIDTSTMEELVRESEALNAVPHFAGLTLSPIEISGVRAEGIASGQEYKVVFNGISAVDKSEIKAANG